MIYLHMGYVIIIITGVQGFIDQRSKLSYDSVATNAQFDCHFISLEYIWRVY